jgi:purine nucleoside phosphorylase
MGRLAVILGSSATGPGGGEVAAAARSHEAVVLQRHGSAEAYVLPHRIDHVANLRFLAAEGCDRVLAVCSVGSLNTELPVGSFVCPDDFIALQTTITSFDDARGHATPGFEPAWRDQVLTAWRESDAGDLHDRGVYWQTNGPRFETPAEIRLIAAHADLVGMTLASECTIATELGLPYAAICVVDNLANGIAAEALSPGEVERHRAANAAQLRAALDAVLPELAGRAGA